MERDERFDYKTINVKRRDGETSWRAHDAAQPGADIAFVCQKLGLHKLPPRLKSGLKNLIIRSDTEIRIAVSQELEAEIKKYYEESNKALSEIIDIPLEKYGYY